jgi:hypothetical protein
VRAPALFGCGWELVYGFCEHGNELSLFVNYRKFGDLELIKEDTCMDFVL